MRVISARNGRRFFFLWYLRDLGFLSGWWFGTFSYFSICWEFHHPKWRTHIFQDGYCTTNQLCFFKAAKVGRTGDHSWDDREKLRKTAGFFPVKFRGFNCISLSGTNPVSKNHENLRNPKKWRAESFLWYLWAPRVWNSESNVQYRRDVVWLLESNATNGAELLYPLVN